MAWHGLGWNPAWFSEIDKFPAAVLKHHFPQVANLGDMTKILEGNYEQETIELLVGGTPCQSFSVAGLRKGLDDPRGNLMLTFGAIAKRMRPKWIVWENVPGVLSSNRGRDFGTFLGMLAEVGYGFAYRILDAQWYGVAQRRRRVFVVGYLGNWSYSAAVLFEPKSMRWYSAPSRAAEQEVARVTEQRLEPHNQYPNRETASKTIGQQHTDTTSLVTQAYSIREDAIANNFSATPIEVSTAVGALVPSVQSHHAQTFIAQTNGVDLYNQTLTGDLHVPLRTAGGHGAPAVMLDASVRRLTPVECERLQGFPDYYTAIPWNNRLASAFPDSLRFRALGNSMAVPVMRWIGQRIQMVENNFVDYEIITEQKKSDTTR